MIGSSLRRDERKPSALPPTTQFYRIVTRADPTFEHASSRRLRTDIRSRARNIVPGQTRPEASLNPKVVVMAGNPCVPSNYPAGNCDLRKTDSLTLVLRVLRQIGMR